MSVDELSVDEKPVNKLSPHPVMFSRIINNGESQEVFMDYLPCGSHNNLPLPTFKFGKKVGKLSFSKRLNDIK